MGLFTRRSDPPLGLDIGSASVKLVALSPRGRQYRIDGFAVEPMPASAMDDGNISDAALVGEAVRRACVTASTGRRTATVAVANSVVIMRTLLLDASLTADELEVEVVLDAERSIPYPIEDVALDFASLGSFPGDASLSRVLLVACPNEQVLAREAALSHAGLKAAAIEVESLAQRRAARVAGAGAADVAILDVGGSAVRLVVWSADESSFVKQEPVPASLGHAEAPGNEAMLNAASRLLDAHAASRPAHAIKRLLLAGGGAMRPDLAAAAAARFEIAVEWANPFAGMGRHGRVDESALAGAAPALMTACGLGLRERR